MEHHATSRAQRLRREAVAAARHARREAMVLGPLLAGVLFVYNERHRIAPGLEPEIQAAAAVALLALSWALARDLGRALGPLFMSRLDSATAGTLGFVIRLVAVALAMLFALRIVGLPARTIAVGGAFTAVVVGLAAQQTLGNLFAGMVLLSARPFVVGDRVRFQGGGLAGQTEGTVVSLGLLYVTLASGADRMMVPNAAALACAVTPLREPEGVDFVARLRPDVLPSDVQRLLDEEVEVETRHRPHIEVRGVDDDELTVRIVAVPRVPEEGWRLADEVLGAITTVTREGEEMTAEHLTTGNGR